MKLKETINEMRELLTQITQDLEKSDNGNKAASQRVRTGTVKLEKVAKQYRKTSIQDEKHTKDEVSGSQKGASKEKANKAPASKAAPKAAPKAAAKKTAAKARSFALRKPTAKIPTRKG